MFPLLATLAFRAAGRHTAHSGAVVTRCPVTVLFERLWWHACSCDGIFIPDIDIANIYNLDQSYTVSSQCVLSPEPSTQTFCPAVRTDAAHKRHMSQYARHHLYNSWRVLQAVRVRGSMALLTGLCLAAG